MFLCEVIMLILEYIEIIEYKLRDCKIGIYEMRYCILLFFVLLIGYINEIVNEM